MYRFMHRQNTQTAEAGATIVDRAPPECQRFPGRWTVVDIADIDGQTQKFEGSDWLEHCLRESTSIGWSFEWPEERSREANNDVALMVFSSTDYALVLRTHRTLAWLPNVVLRVLEDVRLRKVVLGFRGLKEQKIMHTFNMQPQAVFDLVHMAIGKGLAEVELRDLGEKVGLCIHRDRRLQRTNWLAPELTEQQVRFAVEAAYFHGVILEKLELLPDPVREDSDCTNQGVLEIRPEWQGFIVRKADGLYCSICNKGPMNVPMVVLSHIGGREHRQNTEDSGIARAVQGGLPLPEIYIMHGIVKGDGLNGFAVGDFRCIVCNDGPFPAANNGIDVHVNSEKHRAALRPATIDPFECGRWNLPDYVTEEGVVLTCTHCGVKAETLIAMYLHLGGDKHAKRCAELGLDEVMFNEERRRLELLKTGRPVVRHGFKAPKARRGTEEASARPSSKSHHSGAGGLTAGTKQEAVGAEQEALAAVATAARGGSRSSGRGAEAALQQSSNAKEAAPQHSSNAVDLGSHVCIHGLQNKVELNGKQGTCVRWCADTGRWVVELPGDQEVSVKPGNLQVVSDTKATPASTSVPKAASEVKPLPPGWYELQDEESGAIYYWHADTGSQWARPAPVAEEEKTEAAGARSEPEKAPAEVPAAGQQTVSDRSGAEDVPGSDVSLLPPGWQKVWSKDAGKFYYADVETQVAQWDAPPYSQASWSRALDDKGYAFWTCAETGMWFYESDEAWCRLEDGSGNVYWSQSQGTGLRFYESSELNRLGGQ